MLIGRKDAAALAAIGAGIGASVPWLAGDPAAGLLAGAPLAGGAWLAWKRAHQWLDRVDIDSREGFILPSDDPFPETMGERGLRLGYTQDHGYPLDVENTLLMRHTAIIGQSGVGKTTLGEYLLWQQTVRGGGWIFIDAKLDEETRNKLAYMASLMGREDDFYVLNVANPDNSNTYNPILQGGPDEVASRLLNLLPASENSPGADYYRQAANHALTVLTGALQEAKQRYHFGDFSILLQSSQAMMALERMTPQGKARMALQVFLDQFRKKTKEGVTLDTDRIKTVLGGMSGRIALFAQGKFGRVFNTYTPEIDLTDIIVNNKFLYVMLPTMSQDTAALNLGKMVLSDLRTAVANVQGMKKKLRPWPPFKVFADEMGSYVMPGIARLFEQARSAHICMIPAFQSFSNLTAVSPDFADMIIQNTWSKIFFKFGSKDSPETAAEILGKTRRFARSISASQSEGTSAQAANMGPQGSNSDSGGFGESWREAEEFRVTPDQLRALGMGESVVMVGARLFHIRSPMLFFPEELPDFVPVRHPGVIPKGEFALNLELRYREFLMDAGESAVAKVIEQPVIPAEPEGLDAAAGLIMPEAPSSDPINPS